MFRYRQVRWDRVRGVQAGSTAETAEAGLSHRGRSADETLRRTADQAILEADGRPRWRLFHLSRETTMSVTVEPISSQPVECGSISDVPIYRLTVEQYHAMGRAGILTEDDPVELLEGWLVQK